MENIFGLRECEYRRWGQVCIEEKPRIEAASPGRSVDLLRIATGESFELRTSHCRPWILAQPDANHTIACSASSRAADDAQGRGAEAAGYAEGDV
jgi:hypothetical protein